MGIKVMGKAVVGDNHEYIRRAFSTGLDTTDLVICSGGLGPTRMTSPNKWCVRFWAASWKTTRGRRVYQGVFCSSSSPDAGQQFTSGYVPSEAEALPNPAYRSRNVPGKGRENYRSFTRPPREMEPMKCNEVEPRLRRRVGQQKGGFKQGYKSAGTGRVSVEEMLQEVLENPQGAAIALLAHDGEIHIRITLEDSPERATSILQELEDRIIRTMGRHVIGFDQDTLPEVVGKLLREAGLQVAFAESCTGGLAAKLITDLPGSSEFFWGGVVSYANEAKMKLLGVSESTLSRHGAVSPETAQEMARGIRERAGVDIGISITGIAGPGGGSSEKPVGLVYMGLADNREVKVKEQRFIGSREAVRILTAKSALDWLRRYLIGRG